MSDEFKEQTAGSMLREARVAQGMAIDTLAAAIKVAPRKIELLESDRADELLDATFARALAHTVCRSLKIDPVAVLERMPQAQDPHLEQMHQGLNMPFRDKPARGLPNKLSALSRPVVWAPLLLLVAAAAIYFWPGAVAPPARTVIRQVPALPASGVAEGASAPVAASSVPLTPAVETVFAAPAPVENAGSAVQASAVSGVLRLRTTSQSWIEVVDARGQLLLSRIIQPGEMVGLDGPMPLKLRIGNAAGTQLDFRGDPVDLTPHTRENIARLELK